VERGNDWDKGGCQRAYVAVSSLYRMKVIEGEWAGQTRVKESIGK